jgi:hypothetical protein
MEKLMRSLNRRVVRRPISLTQLLLCLFLCGAFAAEERSADVTPSASERFAATDVRETPDFQRHVVPL